MLKFVIWIGFGLALTTGYTLITQSGLEEKKVDIALKQFDNTDQSMIQLKQFNTMNTLLIQGGLLFWVVLGLTLFWKEIKTMLVQGLWAKAKGLLTVLFLMLFFTGCWRPFEPVKLEELRTNEEGFLIPYTGDLTKQAATQNEEFLQKNMVAVKQVRIPQQWVQVGYEWFGVPNGEWRDAARLIKVDKAPVTREWTAEENTGTSKANEGIFVMTSDQVEFSTGWTCTARIASKDDAVKFLHNYPNGSLSQVMDSEIRSKIQATFGMEVTDLPMDELRRNATPHLTRVITTVEDFFGQRGIQITNLGITGGFVYKDKSIQAKLVEVFNSEQEKNINIAKTQAQEEMNKQINLAASGRAEALIKEKKAEADSIKLVADAKAYELEKAKEDLDTYMALKTLEVDVKRTEKWNGIFPQTYFGGEKSPEMLLTSPIK